MRAPSPEVQAAVNYANAVADGIQMQEAVNRGNLVPSNPNSALPSGLQSAASPLSPVLPQTGFANIATAIAAIMSEIGVVGEGGENKFQNYKYMSYKDMFKKLTPLMGRHGLAVIPTEKSRSLFDNDAVISATYSFTIIHKAGEVWPFNPEWTGVSRARDSKGGLDDKALNKCATAAQKYFLKALFQIPSGEDDEDPDHNDGSVSRETKVRAPSPPKSEPPNPFRAAGADASLWTADLKRLIGEAKSLADLNQIDQANAEALERLNIKFPVLYRELYDAFVAAKKKFAKADPISTGPQIVSRYQDDATGFVNSVIDLMDMAKTYEALEALYNQHVAPIERDMFPADLQNCTAAYRRNENRLEP